MNLTIPYSIPFVDVPNQAPVLLPYTANSHCNDGDIVTLGVNVAGEIDPALTNDGSNELLGIIQADSNAVYQQLDTGLQGTFGADNVGTGLLPANAGQQLVALFNAPGAVVEINLSSTTGWISGGVQQANIGTRVGLLKDATTGIYVADPTAANKNATIVEKAQGVTTQIVNSQSAQPFGVGGVGDLAARVRIKFDASALAPAGGGI